VVQSAECFCAVIATVYVDGPRLDHIADQNLKKFFVVLLGTAGK